MLGKGPLTEFKIAIPWKTWKLRKLLRDSRILFLWIFKFKKNEIEIGQLLDDTKSD